MVGAHKAGKSNLQMLHLSREVLQLFWHNLQVFMVETVTYAPVRTAFEVELQNFESQYSWDLIGAANYWVKETESETNSIPKMKVGNVHSCKSGICCNVTFFKVRFWILCCDNAVLMLWSGLGIKSNVSVGKRSCFGLCRPGSVTSNLVGNWPRPSWKPISTGFSLTI